MKTKEYETKISKPARKEPSPVLHPTTMEHLRSMTTDELVKMLTKPESTRSMNATLRQQIIKILQERKGNAFVQKLLEKTPEGSKSED